MKSSDLRRLNRTFEVFGRLPDGRLRIRLLDTFDTELRYFVEDDKAVSEHGFEKDDGTHGTLYVSQATWKMHFWGERIGKGLVLCVWKPPMPKDLFISRYGTMAPWPKNGEYQVIENATFDEDNHPTERACALLKQLLIDMFYRGADPMLPAGVAPARGSEIQDSLTAQYKAKHEATRKQIEDEIDDLMPAFGKPKPGTRGGGVSIGGM